MRGAAAAAAAAGDDGASVGRASAGPGGAVKLEHVPVATDAGVLEPALVSPEPRADAVPPPGAATAEPAPGRDQRERRRQAQPAPPVAASSAGRGRCRSGRRSRFGTPDGDSALAD